MRLTILLLVATALEPSVGAGQTVRGLVTDAATGSPIALATVWVVSERGESVASVLTTNEGFFSLDAGDDGVFLVRATALGYAPNRAGPLELDEGAVRVIEIRMTAAPLGVEGLLVEGTRSDPVGNDLTRRGFWERYEEGRGQFITPGEVLASDAMFTPHLLRGLEHVVAQHGAAPWTVWPMLGVTESSACAPRVYVDDLWVNQEEFGIRETLGLDDVVPIDRIQAVELYYGPFQAPIRYQGTAWDNPCGVVLIWTG
jgi:hypothetical protein